MISFDTDRNMEVRTINHLHRNPASVIHHEECYPNCHGGRYVTKSLISIIRNFWFAKNTKLTIDK